MKPEDYIKANREGWDEVAPLHRSQNQEELLNAFRNDGYSCLLPQETKIFKDLGIENLSVAQLCCNNGRELISIVRMGASHGVGFDVSDEVIAEARGLSELAGTSCSFVRSNVLEIGQEHFDQFDIVFISVGALTWLHDLNPLFEIVAGLLVSGGHLLIHEMHPFLDMLATKLDDEYDPDDQLKIAYSYFSQEPWIDEQGLDYVGDTTYDSVPSISFPHKLSDIISAVIDGGLAITHFREYPRDISAVFAHLETFGKVPLSYSLAARKGSAVSATGTVHDGP